MKNDWLSTIGYALEAWLPVRDLIEAQASVIRGERDILIESSCLLPNENEAYDLSNIDQESGGFYASMQETLTKADALLGTEFASPLFRLSCAHSWIVRDDDENIVYCEFCLADGNA